MKSLRPISVQEANLSPLGLDGDRNLMLVQPYYSSHKSSTSSTHRFVTQRQCSKLATIMASLPIIVEEKKLITLSSDSVPGKSVSIDVSSKALDTYTIKHRAGLWDDVVDVVDVGDEAALFVQSIMRQENDTYNDVRVVSISPKLTDRKTDGRYLPKAALNPFSGNVPNVSLTDGFPILIASEESLGALNGKLREKGKREIPMSRFRPNIVVKGLSKAFEEDEWKAIQIGGDTGPILHVVKGCPRCKQSCTDQLTGERDTEPLETLSEFRAFGKDNEVYFAQNVALQPGTKTTMSTIRVGHEVRVLTVGRPVWDMDTVSAE